MGLSWVFSIAVVTLFVIGTNAETRVATAHLVQGNINGTVTFTEIDDGILVNGSIIGLPAGLYGFHVHELGDISTCLATGGHFDLDGNTHGGREHDVRHIGDLGNVQFEGESPLANFSFVDKVISLRGRNNILGRSLVLHEQEDDLGEGGDEGSLSTGNAGGRVACGVIGIKSPATPWNAAINVGPSTVLLVSLTFFFFVKY
ncbi:uncharacterized protein LOC126371883 [Pectinophora gossypiella]|uniref:uncharacterized protein LOC126371883 n=1 Tax=Pectinophora gossypiella TaxID=13191 RepID=UPI00214EF543|nr:uncharacterized protein LOC126371883 [Pectinophora gossypiella]